MKKGEKNRLLPAGRYSDDALHLRLCHFCFYLNESQEEILKCNHCRRSLTLQSLISSFTEEDSELDEVLEVDTDREDESNANTNPPPIHGLTVLW